MRSLFILISAFISLIVITATVSAQNLPPYAYKTGDPVTVFERKDLNYRIEMPDRSYSYFDIPDELPEASISAINLKSNIAFLVIVEDFGATPSAKQYAELVRSEMSRRLASLDDTSPVEIEDLGTVYQDGRQFYQMILHANVESMPLTYVIYTTVDGGNAYQLLTWGRRQDHSSVRMEANAILASFSLINPTANEDVEQGTSSILDYRSQVFGYRLQARDSSWFEWTDVRDSYGGADFGAMSTRGFGSIVIPLCWQGARPTDNAIYQIMMQQFGEGYPSDFISEDRDIEKDGAVGKLLIGTEPVEGEEFVYYHWIVPGENCAYALAAYGPADQENIAEEFNSLWDSFQILGQASSLAGVYDNDKQKAVNALLLNELGTHYYGARSFRDATRFFKDASDLSPSDEVYVVNALQSLAEIEAYRESNEWLQPRLGQFADSQAVQSWAGWIAFQVDDVDKAIRVYRKLFATDYRSDDDFSVFLTLLADNEQWDEVDSTFEAYTVGGVNDSTRLLQVQLLSRRGRYEEALAELDKMTSGRPFDADLAYERLEILASMGSAAEILALAESLIENGYRSLESYYYKGDAEYQLRSYQAARKSFEEALTFSPGNSRVREYIEAIDSMLGQGDVSTISTTVAAVPLPDGLDEIFAEDNSSVSGQGYGAEYLSRITGYDYSGGETRTQTMYQKIRIIDDNGVSHFSTLEFNFDPSFERLYVNSLIVKDAQGNVLAEGDIKTYYITNDEDSYNASTKKTVHLPVPGLAPGIVIEAIVSKLTSVEENTFPFETIYMTSDRPIGHSAVFVTGSRDELQYRANGIAEPKRRGESMIWELRTPVTFRWEPLQPYVDQILPWLQLGTVGEDWASVGAKYLAEIEGKLDTKLVADQARRLIEGVDSETRRIEILSAYVQEKIRYEAIEFGRRAYMPKTARDTTRDRYGDCKDHAVLLYALMKSVGIDASLALVSLRQTVIPDLPNRDQFNHMIVAVPTRDGRIFIDTTDKDMRLGQLAPRLLAGNHALVLGETSELIKIPDYDATLTGLNVQRIVEAGDDGYVDVTETARVTGYQGAELRGQLRTIETPEMQASLQRWVADRYSDAEVTDYFVENLFDASYDLIVELKYTLPLNTDGGFDVPGFLEAFYLDYPRIAGRRFAFEFSYPWRVTATTLLKLPSGRKPDSAILESRNGESKFGQWRREVSESDAGWKIQFHYAAPNARFGPGDYREFSDFQRKAVDAIELPLSLR